MKNKIKNVINKTFLAPMAGITDIAFREICTEFHADGLTSEMVSVKGIIFKNQKTLHLTQHSDKENIFSIQLFGSEPEDFSKAAKIISEINPYCIDINMGCPAPKVVSTGAGSALMKNPYLCAQIVYQIKKTTDIPVSIKIRSGWDEKNINAPEVAFLCQQAGAEMVTVHGRTAKQMYSGKADLDVIKAVKEKVDIPVVGNGDIINAQSAQKMLEYTGCDSVAIGRGALGNPWIFKEIHDVMSGKDFCPPSIEERLSVMLRHIKKMCLYKGDNIGIMEARKHAAWYVKGINGAAEFRKKLFLIENIDDLNKICEQILNLNSDILK